MKRLTLSLLALAVLAGNSLTEAQESKARAKSTTKKKAAPSSVALIDMAHVFQNYDKFKELRQDLQSAVAQSDAEAKEMAARFQELQKRLTEESQQLDPGSPEYEKNERDLLDEKGKFEAWRAATQRKLARRETEMLKVIYADVSDMVAHYAKWAEYSLVLRFNSKGVEDDMQPQQAIQSMNKNVIYYQTGNDITKVVLRQLNSQYGSKSGGTPAKTTGQRRTIK